MILTEYDEERRRALDRQHGYDEGVEDGIEKGIEQGIEHPAERLRAAGCDEETIRIVLGSKPAE